MGTPQKISKVKAAETSRHTILDAAEALFAAHGFESTSLQAICDRAGVARGTPAYFFGSKEELYLAVLERAFAPAQALIGSLRELADRPGADVEANLRRIVEHVFDFLVAHPTFVRITEWESLSGGHRLGTLPVLATVLRDALEVLRRDLGWRGDAEQFLIDLVALCWFPVAHAETFLAPLGVDAHAPAFLRERRAHVVQTFLAKHRSA